MSNRTFKWYAQQLSISESTAKRRGKKILALLYRDRQRSLDTSWRSLLETETPLPFPSAFDYALWNEDSRQRGVVLLNLAFDLLQRALQDDAIDLAQRARLAITISRVILGSVQ